MPVRTARSKDHSRGNQHVQLTTLRDRAGQAEVTIYRIANHVLLRPSGALCFPADRFLRVRPQSQVRCHTLDGTKLVPIPYRSSTPLYYSRRLTGGRPARSPITGGRHRDHWLSEFTDLPSRLANWWTLSGAADTAATKADIALSRVDVENLEARIDARFDSFEDRITKLMAENFAAQTRWVVGSMVVTMLALVAAVLCR